MKLRYALPGQAGGSIYRNGVAVVDVAFDDSHKLKELEIVEQELVLARVVAVGGDNEFRRAVEDALNLRQVVAVQQGVGGERLEADQNLVLGEVVVKTLTRTHLKNGFIDCAV